MESYKKLFESRAIDKIYIHFRSVTSVLAHYLVHMCQKCQFKWIEYANKYKERHFRFLFCFIFCKIIVALMVLFLYYQSQSIFIFIEYEMEA